MVRTPARTGVRVQLVGPFAVSVGESVVTGSDLGSRKARGLLKLLAVERARVVPIDRIVEAVWGAAPPASPAENVATLVSRIRRVLGADAIIGGRAGYRLGVAPAVVVDLDEIQDSVGDAERRLVADEPALAVALARRAEAALAADVALVDEPAGEWPEPARDEQTALLRRARHVIAAAGAASGDVALAVAAAQSLIEGDRYDERGHRALMRAHYAGGEQAKALTTYAVLRDLLADELGADPAPETEAVHVALLRGQAPPP
jgi:DNA-binding SARP family transcriptional activator